MWSLCHICKDHPLTIRYRVTVPALGMRVWLYWWWGRLFSIPQAASRTFHFFFFPFFFFGHLWHMAFLGQGSDPSHSCNLRRTCGNAGSLNPLCPAGD